MAYSFVEKKPADIQKENTYILYMIIGSLFNKCFCYSKMLEKNLYLYYKEMSFGKQINREKSVINTVNKILAEKIGKLEDMNCEVTIKTVNDQYQLLFDTCFEVIQVVIEKDGKYKITLK